LINGISADAARAPVEGYAEEPVYQHDVRWNDQHDTIQNSDQETKQ
jgi:hypothetical protein